MVAVTMGAQQEMGERMTQIKKSGKSPKGMARACIIEILKNTDQDNSLTQNDIRTQLEERYEIKVDKKTLHRYIDDLAESLEGLQFRTVKRNIGGRESNMKTDFWLEQDDMFDEQELRMLIYDVIFSKHMPVKVKKELVGKLERLSSNGLSRKMQNYVLEDANTTDSFNELTWNMELISEAIDEKKRVSFRYTRYHIDKKLRSTETTYTVSPLGIAARDDDFHLVAVVNGVQDTSPEDMIGHFEAVVDAMEGNQVHVDVFRMDRITGIEKLDEAAEDLSRKTLGLRGVKDGKLDVQRYLRENPQLKPGHTVQATFRLTEDGNCTLHDVIDHFGKANVTVTVDQEQTSRTPGIYTFTVRTNDTGLKDFALRHSPCIEVLEPENIRGELAATYHLALERMLGELASTHEVIFPSCAALQAIPMSQ